ncbi:DNA-binding domain-containing protein [Isoalcanivorax indicus]|uniref:HvfC family RiPP maturation protein n=1 Tax=Isoalcanivorax indicus TaxID=2202653 RepID=UPI001FE61150|nr:putative DNA-binding domain-containing protein [Isoalcanivorax indicus]
MGGDMSGDMSGDRSGPPFQAVQRAFAAHLRDPAAHPVPPGLEARRVEIYRSLVFNNVSQFLSGTFPVLTSLLPAARWQTLVRDFLRLHRSHSPYFRDIPEAFLTFLADSGTDADDPPWLGALAHYEWMELVLDTDDTPAPEVDSPDGDLMQHIPVLSPWCAVLAYDWPVHRLCATFQPTEPLAAPVWLLVYRDREEQVRFMELNALTAALVQQMQGNGTQTGQALLHGLAAAMQHPSPDSVLAFGADLLADLQARGVIAGICYTPRPASTSSKEGL